MVVFANVQRQYPEVWIKQRGSVTAREVMYRYKLRTEAEAIRMLDNLVRNRKLQRTSVDGEIRWSAV